VKIYLDVCCLNRPFDDPAQARIAVEAAAVTTLFELIESGRLTDYSSEMAQVEIERMSDAERRRNVTAFLPPRERIIPLTDILLDAAEALRMLGFDLADAVHLAAARSAGVDVFLTVDDRLLRRTARRQSAVGIRVINPVVFLQEMGHGIHR
jgi:predicted nucleic acid-binding protein